MLRPRESHDLSLIASEVISTPPGMFTWDQDVFGNAVATAEFTASADALTVTSIQDVRVSVAAPTVFRIAASALSFPFSYTRDDWADLGSLRLQQYLDNGGQLSAWARGFVMGPATDTFALLKDISAGVSSCVAYQSREAQGVQSPIETLNLGSGSCRDIALLFIEAVRSLGFGARIVSGYLHNPGQAVTGSSGPGSTHAWAEVYLPGPGWITFDPTNRSLGGANLIPVAVGRDIHQVVPVAGGYIGSADAFDHMAVSVIITSLDD